MRISKKIYIHNSKLKTLIWLINIFIFWCLINDASEKNRHISTAENRTESSLNYSESIESNKRRHRWVKVKHKVTEKKLTDVYEK